ncbi:MAG: class I SAM-dependent methyltransferase family protein [Candidatus Helarchaeota archaeon]|nr:class I SAM-dependent methyltransferase family protein [Candidatus Helarchaeota archaeon]
MDSSWCILVQKKDGENLRQWLLSRSLLNRDIKIESKDEFLIFPLGRELNDGEKKNLIESFEIIRFEHRNMELKLSKKPKGLFGALESSIPENLHMYIPKSFDIIGQLAIIEIPEELESFEALIGSTLLNLHPSLKSIFKKLEPIKGDFRLRNLQLLAGINNSETVHKENKCKYEMDIKKVYFSPRLVTEHARVCSLVKKNEIILDMFAGIGPFSILIAKQKQAQVFAVDINPAAIYYLERNSFLNKVENFVTPLEGNVRDVIKNYIEQKFDRIIMNLPLKSCEFLDVASQVLKKDGIIHYYQFASESDFPTKVLDDLKNEIVGNGRKVEEILEIRKVRPYAPYIWQIGIDILVN